jgi:hypothetical protein
MSGASEATDKVCWQCGAPLESERIGFRAMCDACSAWLHCCKNCRFYMPGKPNDCAIPGTDLIVDREASNLCEEYKLLGEPPPPPASPDAFHNLFK